MVPNTNTSACHRQHFKSCIQPVCQYQNHTADVFSMQIVSTYEHHWKIQTKINKFKVIPVAYRIPQPITNFLGFQFTITGFITNIIQIITQTQVTIFMLHPINKTQALQTIRPFLEYTTIPLVAISIPQKTSVQDRALYVYRPNFRRYRGSG